MKVAIVTGGARGIGRQIAIDLAKNGYNVVINYNNSAKEAEEVKAICDEYNEALIIKADVSKFDNAEILVNEAINKFGQIDLLVNNAGITKDNLVLRMTEEDFDRVINVNLKGAFNMIKHASKFMLKKRSGVIINMSSVIGEVGNVGQLNYASSKGGIIAMTKSAAKEFAKRGIRVNAIAPGYIETDMTNALSDDIKNEILKEIPIGRIGKPCDVSNAVLFLANDSSSYITGQVLNICGGMVM